uniref:Glycosyltransferase family 92 protein n=1 Tax=Panagrellus redivivus TaxID=6233 RepID=A0A7E4VKG6_PANRE
MRLALKKTLPIHISFLTTLFIIILVKIYIVTDPQEYADIQFTTQHKLTSPKPIFVIKTYYYPNSKSFKGKDAVVTIFNGERLKYKHQHFECNRTLASGKSERSRGKVLEIIYGPRQCKLTVFRLTCLFPARNEELADFNVGMPSPETGVMQYGALTVSQPNKKPYGFVSCMSRMIAFDDWALVIFAMETFRLYGGDLVVAPVECAIKEVMQLLRLYEADGILRVTGGFRARKLPNSYDPNTETEYSNQMSSSHECFYHYKESAEFIAFTDWDDILVGYRSGSYIKTFYEAFSPFIETHPYAAAFTINRINAYQKPPMRQTDKTFSLGASFRRTHYVAAFLDEKMVIRPHLVAGCWIHEMKIAEDDKYHQIAVNGSVATLLHLHDTIAGKGERPRMPADARIIGNASEFVDANALDANFRDMTHRHSFSFESAEDGSIAVPKPLFVVQTYYYSRSKSFNGTDAIVTLFNGERINYERRTVICSRKLDDGSSESVTGIITQLIDGPIQCKLTMFRLVCLFPPSNYNVTQFDVGVAKNALTVQYGTLTVSQPNKKPYGFVSCMSRMIAFDDWALVIFAMETFRLYGGDLVVAPVECAIKEVMQLLKLYESDGILTIRGGFKAPILNNIDYDPNTQTEFNQMSSSHECFYEFKESAEFIAFTDWDDILIGRRKGSEFLSFRESFAPFLKTHPKAAAFSVNRIDAYLKSPIRSTDAVFSLGDAFRKARYVSAFLDEKMVIRPHLVAGCWIHEMNKPENDQYHQISVNGSIATMLHLHDTLVDEGETKRLSTDLRMYDNASVFVDPEALDSNFKEMVERHSFHFDHKKYSYFRLFYNLISRCYKHILHDLTSNSVTYCPSFKTCVYPPQKVDIVKTEIKYNHPIVTGPFVWVLVALIMQVDEFLKKILALTSLTNLCQDHWHESTHCVPLFKYYTLDNDGGTAHGKVHRVVDSKEGKYDEDPYLETSLPLTSQPDHHPLTYSHKIMKALIVHAPGDNSLIASSDSDFVPPAVVTSAGDPPVMTEDPCFLEFDVAFCVSVAGINYYDSSMKSYFFEHGIEPPGEVLAFDPCDVTIIYIVPTTHELKKVHLYDTKNIKAAGILRDWTPSICNIGVKGLSTGPVSFSTFSKVLSHENTDRKFVEVELCEYECPGFFKSPINIVLLVFAILFFLVDLIVLGLFLWFCVIRKIRKRKAEAKNGKKKQDKDEYTETMATTVAQTNAGTTMTPSAVEGASAAGTPEAGTPTKTPGDPGATTFATSNDMTHMKMTLDL